MRTLFFDTETTGLPKQRNVSALQSPHIWPDLVSISWILCNGSNIIKKDTYIIKPAGWVIPDESIRIHGITNKQANEDGMDLATVLGHFKKDVLSADRIFAHNMEFDRNVIIHAYKWRLEKDPMEFWSYEKEACSMLNSKGELKLPSRFPKPSDPYKNPGLDELYRHTFQEEAPKGAHSADRDVDVLYRIVVKRWPILL